MVPGSSGLLFSERMGQVNRVARGQCLSSAASSGNPNTTHRRGSLPRQDHRRCSLLRSEVLVCSIENSGTQEWIKDVLSAQALGVHLSSLESELIL